MAGLVAELVTELKVKSDDFNRGMDLAMAKASHLEKAVSGAAVGMTVAITATVVAIGAIGAAVLAQTPKIDAMAHSAEKLGIGTEAFQALSYAAFKADTDISSVEGSLVKLVKSLSDTDKEGNAANAALKRMGINANEFKHLGLDQQLLKLSDGFKTLPAGAAQIQTSLDLFGRAGAGNLNLLQSNIRQVTARFKELGYGLSTLDIEKVRMLDDAMEDLSAKNTGFLNHLTADLAEPFSVLINSITGGFGDVRVAAGKLSIFILEAAGGALRVFNGISSLVSGMVGEMKSLLSSADSLLEKTLGKAYTKPSEGIGMLLQGVFGSNGEGSPSRVKSTWRSATESEGTTNISRLIAQNEEKIRKIGDASTKASDGLSKAGDAAKDFTAKLTNGIDTFFKGQGAGGIDRILKGGPDGQGGEVVQAQDNTFDDLIRGVAFKKVTGQGAENALVRAQNIAEVYGRLGLNNAEMLNAAKEASKFYEQNKSKFDGDPAAATPWSSMYQKGVNSYNDSTSSINPANFLRDKVEKEQQKVLVEVAPTSDFIVKVSDNAYTKSKITNTVENMIADAAAGVSS